MLSDLYVSAVEIESGQETVSQIAENKTDENLRKPHENQRKHMKTHICTYQLPIVQYNCLVYIVILKDTMTSIGFVRCFLVSSP